MKNISLLFVLAVVPLAGICATTTTAPERSAFTFVHEGSTYKIISTVDPADGGGNYLVLRGEGRLLLRAWDTDQDGTLDTVLAGAITLDRANGIYATGIAEARTRGKYREHTGSTRSYKVLVFSRTAGYRHASIPDGIAAIRELGPRHGFAVEATEDPAVFTDAGLAPYRVVLFLNTTLDVLDAAQQDAFEQYIRAGGGFVGVHSAADTEYDWPWYGGLVGAYFDSHPEIQTATIEVTDRVHPSTKGLPVRWERTDEWYNYRANPRDGVHVLATLDEATYSGGTMEGDHPISWCHAYDGGRAWYTGMGHTPETYAEPLFRAHLLGGIEYAAGVAAGDCAVNADDAEE